MATIIRIEKSTGAKIRKERRLHIPRCGLQDWLCFAFLGDRKPSRLPYLRKVDEIPGGFRRTGRPPMLSYKNSMRRFCIPSVAVAVLGKGDFYFQSSIGTPQSCAGDAKGARSRLLASL